MTRPLWLMTALVLMMSAGCTAVRMTDSAQEPWLKAGGPRPAGDSESLLMYYEYARSLPPAELAKEHDAVRELYSSSNANSDFLRVRYAMLLSIPGTAFNAEARALELIDPLLKNADAGLHGLAFMVSAQIQEQRRGHAMQQKLDALRSLEKNLIERDTGGARRR